MPHLKRNLSWPFGRKPAPKSAQRCARRSSATVGDATHAAYKAGQNKGDTALFNSWLCERGLQDRGAVLRNRLEAEFRRGVEDGEDRDTAPTVRTTPTRPAAPASSPKVPSVKGKYHYKGYTVQQNEEGDWYSSLDRDSLYDSYADVKHAIDDRAKGRNPRRNPVPVRSGLRSGLEVYDTIAAHTIGLPSTIAHRLLGSKNGGGNMGRNPRELNAREVSEWLVSGERMGREAGVGEAQAGRPKRDREKIAWLLPIPLRDHSEIVAATVEGYDRGYDSAARGTAWFTLTLYSKREAEQESASLKRRGYVNIEPPKKGKSEYGGTVFTVRAMSPDTRALPVPHTARKENPYLGSPEEDDGIDGYVVETASEVPVFQAGQEGLPGVVPFVAYTTLPEALAYAQACKGLYPSVGIVAAGESYGVIMDAEDARNAEAQILAGGAVEILERSNPAGADDAEYADRLRVHLSQLQDRMRGASLRDYSQMEGERDFIRATLKFYDNNQRLPSLADSRADAMQNPAYHLGVSVSLSSTPPNANGMVEGPWVRVSHGRPLEVLERKTGKQARWLVKVDNYGMPLWGWIDKEYVERGVYDEGHNPAAHGYVYHVQNDTRGTGEREPRWSWVGLSFKTAAAAKKSARILAKQEGRATRVLHKDTGKVEAEYKGNPAGVRKMHVADIAPYTRSIGAVSTMKNTLVNIRKEQKRAGGGGEIVQAVDSQGKHVGYVFISGGSTQRRNPLFADADSQTTADALYEDFHGAPPTETVEVVTEIDEPDHLTTLGTLVSLVVATVTGLEVTIGFDGREAPYLTSVPDGTQLYIEGGDQSIDLKALKMSGEEWERRQMMLGDLIETTYRTEKKFDKFRQIDYYHANGEESGIPPQLVYDPVNCLLSIVGGKYKVLPEGIVD